MRCLASSLALGVLAAMALGQPQPTPGQATPNAETNARPKSSTPTPATDQSKPDEPESPSAGSDKAKSPQSKPARAEPGNRPGRNVHQILDSRVPEVKFDQTPLEKVMHWVQDYTGAIVYVRWAALEEVGITRETPITVKAREKKLSQILWVIMNEAAAESGVTLAYQASADLFVFSTHEDFSRDMVTRVYNVQEIIVDIPMFAADGTGGGAEGRVPRTRVRRRPPPERRSRSGELIRPSDEGPRREVIAEDERLQEIMELILNTIEPESWEVNGMGGRGTIFPYKGKLIVRNSVHVQQLIAGLQAP